MKTPAASLQRVFTLLRRIRPVPEGVDVAWRGPYFIPRPGLWCPTHFTLYDGTLYARLFVPPAGYDAVWKVGSKEVRFESGSVSGDYQNGEALWEWALAQIERRLLSAMQDLPRYNRFIERRLPLSCRVGKIQRRLTWRRKARPPLPARQILSLENILGEAKGRPPLPEMTSSRYLATAAVAYDAVFKDLRPLPPLGKYKKKADGRHGGLLDLPGDSAEAFSRWFRSDQWSGTHPWEIVFGHPHGIMISPRYHENTHSWTYWLWVDSLGWYVTAARMALALGERGIPFAIQNEKEVLDAIKGTDDVGVSPDLYDVHYEDLKEQRPDSLRFIRWDPIAPMEPMTPEAAVKVDAQLKPR
jgi:hypothetical protein